MNNLLFTVLMYMGVGCVQDYKTICGVRFIDSYDGDTFTVTIPNGGHPIFSDNIPIRMLGIDAPEMDSVDTCEIVKAKQAADMAKKILSTAKKIDLHDVARDKYFRLLAVPVVDGLSVPQQLIDARLAVGYAGDTKKKIDWCKTPPEIKK
jgi:micrococcal nuclease